MSVVSSGVAEDAGARNPRTGLGRPAVVLSIVFHVAGFFLIVGVPRLLASGPDTGKVYVVDLVTLPGEAGPGPLPAAPPAPEAAAKPAPQKETPKPATTPPKPPPVKKPAEKAIVIPDKNAKKTTTKKPAEEKVKEPPKPIATNATDTAEEAAAEAPATNESPQAKPGASAAATPANPNAAPGAGTGAGGEGQGTGGGGDAYTFYLALLKRNIESAWKRPVYNGDTTLTATVSLRISSAGRVQRLELKAPSGLEPLDRSLLTAVRAAEPFPPFPAALAMDSLQVQIVFELTPEGSAPNPGD